MWSVHACVEFEKRGIPSTVIVTDVFEERARQLLRSLKYPHIPVLVTPNPVIYLEGPEIYERVKALLGKVISSLTSSDQ